MSICISLISVSLLFVSDIGKRFSIAEILQVFDKLVNAVAHELFVLLSAMRSDQDVWERPKFALLDKRLLLENVEDSTCNYSFFESFCEVIFLNGWASSNVHEYGGLLHFGEG